MIFINILIYLPNFNKSFKLILEKGDSKKHNLCIAYFRFIFLESCTNDKNEVIEKSFDIRIPLGDFQFSQLLDPKDFLQIFKKSNYHEKQDSDWQSEQKGKSHSEKVLLAWIVQNGPWIKEQISLKINNIQTRNLVLLKVYLELTSETRVCKFCIRMLLKFSHKYILDLIGVNIKVAEEFYLIIVSSFLHESQNQGRFSQRKRIHSIDNSRKKTIYLEFGQMGLITENYLNNRYISSPSQSFTQKIDEIKLKNTFFLSDDIDDETQQQQNEGNVTTSSGSTMTRAEIYNPLTTALVQIQKQQEKPINIAHCLNEKTIYQERILQCYQLIWHYQKHQDQKLNEIDVHLFQMHLQQWIIFDFQSDPRYHFDFLKRNTIFQKLSYQQVSQMIQNKMHLKSLFERGISNTELLFLDYIFLNNYTTNQPELLGLDYGKQIQCNKSNRTLELSNFLFLRKRKIQIWQVKERLKQLQIQIVNSRSLQSSYLHIYIFN